LQLSPRLNCLYLRNTGTDVMTGWDAFVVPGNSDSRCPRPPADAIRLPVSARNLGFNNSADYPAVARFEEIGGKTLIGIKCLNRWCEIGPTVAEESPPHLAASGAGSSRVWHVKGWYDDQTIVAKDAGGAVVGRFRASIIPVENLETLTSVHYRSAWRHVATIWASQAPPPTSLYATDWKLKRGLNKLWLRHFPSRPPREQWRAALQGPDSTWTNTSIPVNRHAHHDVLVPGTARWRFVFTDEIIWVRCDQGCCQVDASGT
jgi:hypothetical protein